MTEQRYRRAAGALIGIMFGFAYTLVSQLINRLALPGIPLYQPPLGPVGNILLGLLAGAGLGLLCAWPASGAKGILLGGAAAAAGGLRLHPAPHGRRRGVHPGRPGPLGADGVGERARHGRRALAGRPPGRGAAGVGPVAPPPAPAADPDRRAGARGCLRSFQRRRPARTAPDARHDPGRAGRPRHRRRCPRRSRRPASPSSRPGGLPIRSNGRTSSWIASSSCARRRAMTDRPR